MEKRNTLTATAVAGSFLVSFLLLSAAAENLFLQWSPSQYEDDVRFDLFLPVAGSAYILSALVSFLIGRVSTRMSHTKVSIRTHVRFVLLFPPLFFAAHIVTALIFALVSVGYSTGPSNNFILYLTMLAVLIRAYYWLLSRDKRVH